MVKSIPNMRRVFHAQFLMLPVPTPTSGLTLPGWVPLLVGWILCCLRYVCLNPHLCCISNFAASNSAESPFLLPNLETWNLPGTAIQYMFHRWVMLNVESHLWCFTSNDGQIPWFLLKNLEKRAISRPKTTLCGLNISVLFLLGDGHGLWVQFQPP